MDVLFFLGGACQYQKTCHFSEAKACVSLSCRANTRVVCKRTVVRTLYQSTTALSVFGRNECIFECHSNGVKLELGTSKNSVGYVLVFFFFFLEE